MKRALWRLEQKGLDPERLVFLDETWAKTNMTRPRGRALRGERLIAKVPHGHWKTTTFLAALRTSGLSAPLVVDGAINGAVFRAYVEQQLAPTLRRGDIVIMDNLNSHKVKGVREAIETRARTWCTCRHTVPTSTQSSWSLRSSNGCCGATPPKCGRPLGFLRSAAGSLHSTRMRTTSVIADTRYTDPDVRLS